MWHLGPIETGTHPRAGLRWRARRRGEGDVSGSRLTLEPTTFKRSSFSLATILANSSGLSAACCEGSRGSRECVRRGNKVVLCLSHRRRTPAPERRYREEPSDDRGDQGFFLP